MLFRSLILIAIILTTSACQSTLVRPQGEYSVAVNPYEMLERADRAKNFSRQQQFRLQAAQAFLNQGQYALAQQTLNSMPAQSQATTEFSDAVARARAQTELGLQNYPAAETALQSLSNLTPQDMLLLAQICTGLNNFSCAADGYIQASIVLGMDDETLPEDINDRIWLALSRAQQAPAAYTNRYHHGWWLLQQNIRTAGSITGQLQAWQKWQNQYPSHPARLRPPKALLKLNAYHAPKVALLLPLSGSFATAGQAVRDGLIAAFLTEQGLDKPRISFYDTASDPLAIVYEQALADGAEVLVGPLLREQVEAFAELSNYAPVPRLVLNYLSPPGTTYSTVANNFAQTSPLYQFGIAIEDEIASLASHVLLEGPERLMVVYSNARWSQRAFNAYIESWPHTVTPARFNDIKGLTGAIGEAMQVAASDARKNQLANILGTPLEFLPRARADIDGVVALTTQVEARALVPALRFHFADQLPVYATSQILLGDDIDGLEGFELTQMPLFSSPEEQLRDFRAAFDLTKNPFAELYALGYDAYRLATWLPILTPDAQVAMPAASGYLWLEPGGKFRRDLQVSRLGANGELAPIN